MAAARSAFVLALAGALFCGATATAQEATLVDRVVAVVDGEIVTLGQLQRAVDLFQTGLDMETGVCFLEPPGNEPGAREAFVHSVLECEINELLAFQHVRRFPQFDVIDDAIERAYESLVDEYPSPEEFAETLSSYGLSSTELRYDLERQALIGNYLDVRFAQMIDVSPSEIRRYYEGELRTEMDRIGAGMPPIESVTALIEATLGVAEFNRRVEDWVADLRRRADITVYLW